mmetsp:Transcript_41099/g.124146  ORF Transcript_41099/g.124146 Transcript_41099/m.124146 type:complete len:200 (+) Transcript_41099:5667-6266(+)
MTSRRLRARANQRAAMTRTCPTSFGAWGAGRMTISIPKTRTTRRNSPRSSGNPKGTMTKRALMMTMTAARAIPPTATTTHRPTTRRTRRLPVRWIRTLVLIGVRLKPLRTRRTKLPRTATTASPPPPTKHPTPTTMTRSTTLARAATNLGRRRPPNVAKRRKSPYAKPPSRTGRPTTIPRPPPTLSVYSRENPTRPYCG